MTAGTVRPTPLRRHTAARVAATIGLAVGVLCVPTGADAAAPTCASAGLSVTPLHGPSFYTDLASVPRLNGAYAGYRVGDTSGSARSDLWVELDEFSGGSVGLGYGQAPAQQIATLGADAATSKFWYLSASSLSTTAQRHAVTVYDGRPDLPGSTAVCATTGGFASVEDTIKAAANKLTSVSVGGGGTPALGATFVVTVQGQTGTIGSGTATDPGSFWMSPAAAGSWPADAYRLVSTTLSFAGGGSYADTLRVANLSGASRDYTATYTFRAIGFTSGPTGVLPVQQIASGTQIKHTDTGSLATLPAIQPASNDLRLTGSADPTRLPADGGTVTLAVHAEGTPGAALDDIVDTLPVGATVVPGSATWNGLTVPDPRLNGHDAVFQGPFTLTAGDDTLRYRIAVAASPGDQVNEVRAHVGSAQIDTTVQLGDDAPLRTSTNVNAAPRAVADTAAATEGRPEVIAVLANDTDADGDELSITHVGGAAHGVVTTDGTTLTYTGSAGYTGPDSVTYTVSDGRGGTDTATVSLTVTAAPAGNRAPRAAPDTASAVEGRPLVIDVLGNDVDDDGHDLVVDAVGEASHATVTTDGGAVTYTSTPGYTGPDSFTYTVSDAHGGTDTATVSVTVTAAPAVAHAVDDEATVAPGASATIDVLANDTGEGLRVTDVSGAGASIEDGARVAYTAPDEPGTYEVGYTVTDTDLNTSSARITITVPAPPAEREPLVGRPDEVEVRAGSSATVDVLANDTGDGLVLGALGAAAHGEVRPVPGGGVRYTPARDVVGADSFVYALSDAHGDSQAVEVGVRVTEVDPGAEDETTTPWNTPVDVDVLANDPAGSEVATLLGDPEHGEATVVDGVVRYEPRRSWTGPDSLTYRLVGSRTPVAVVVTTTPPDLAPQPDRATTTRAERALRLEPLGNDRGTDLRLTSVGAPTHGTARAVGDEIRYTPAADFTGTDIVDYSVTDVVGRVAQARVTIQVEDVAPVLGRLPRLELLAGRDAVVDLSASDPDGDRLRVSTGRVTGTTGTHPAARLVTAGIRDDGRLQVQLDPAFSGVATVPVRADDGHGLHATRDLRLVVHPRSASAVRAKVLGDPGPGRALRAPAFRRGVPVSRVLDSRLDSRVTWRASSTQSVRRYSVTVDGEEVCSVTAGPHAGSCVVRGRVLRAGDRVRVTAVGGDAVPSRAMGGQVTASRRGHLVAVVYFPVGEFSLGPAARTTLRQVASQARAAGYERVRMSGHTDSDGSRASNARLSSERSGQVARWLLDHTHGVRVTSTNGYGETRPAMPNQTTRGRSANRRVEIYAS